ncbi:hypothetical protein [Arthrobacter sp. UYCu723]
MSTNAEAEPTVAAWDIREASDQDWPAIWEILEPVVRGGGDVYLGPGHHSGPGP